MRVVGWLSSLKGKRFHLSKPTAKFLTSVAAYRRQLSLGIICLFLAHLTKLCAPSVLRYAVDALMADAAPAKLMRYGGLLILIALTQALLLFVQRRTIMNVSMSVQYDLRNELYAHLQKLPLQFYQKVRTGDLMARALNDLTAIRMVVGPALISTLNALFAIVLVLPLMLSLSWSLTLLAFFPMVFVVALTRFFSRRLYERAAAVQEQYGVVANSAQEALAGVRVTRAYRQEQTSIADFKRVNKEFVRENLRLIRLSAIFQPSVQLLVGLGFVVAFWYGGHLIIKGGMTIGQFLQFSLYLGYLVWPMIGLGMVVNQIQRGKASMVRVQSILSIDPPIRDGEKTREVSEIGGEIEFRDLTFTYKSAVGPSLKEINLRIAPGQTVAFVGAVGSGKTTLVNLVPRLLSAGSGQVLIDGYPIEELPLRTLRSSIGYVPQETLLFSGTVAENIAFGVQQASAEEIERAALEAGIADDIRWFSEGYETVIGERGVTLSGGQKQRTAIARALLRRPRILILDDALSSVDTHTEGKILGHLREIMRGCTSLIVSHRVSTVRDADLIVVLDEGRIVEQGTHDELLWRGRIYAELFEKQRLEEMLEATPQCSL